MKHLKQPPLKTGRQFNETCKRDAVRKGTVACAMLAPPCSGRRTPESPAVHSGARGVFRAGSRRCPSFAFLLAAAVLLSLGPVRAAPPTDASDPFYDPADLATIALEILPDDLDRIRRALPRRISVPGTFRWKDQTLGPVGIRYKGNSSSAPESPHKRSFLISFAEYREDGRFLGLRHVALDNGIQFGGLFGECLITDILRGVGVRASRCNHVRVTLNGKPAGVYVNVERIDRSFLERHFESATGPLFKVDEGGPGADLGFLGDDPAPYRKAFELHSGDAAEGYGALVEFVRAVNHPGLPGAGWERQLDVESFLKTTAVLLLAGAFDQYTGWAPHNYYLYRNPTDRRWTYIPWDLDVGFADRAFGRVPVLEGWHAAWPVPVPGRPLMERVVSDADLLRRYREHARTILEEWFRPEVLIPKLRGLHARLRPALAEDPHPLGRATVPTDTGIGDTLASMEKFIRDRYVLAGAQLAAPGERPTPTPTPMAPEPRGKGPHPGPASADAPTDLRAIRADGDGVELRWADHAEGEVAHVVQRCEGGDCEDFANAIGQGGPNVTSATDRRVQRGRVYRYRVYAVLPTPQGPRGTGVSNVIQVTVP